MEFIQVEREDGVATLTINRQDKLNTLNPQVIEELGQALLELQSAEVRAIIVTGAGERAFVAGADVSEMSGMSPQEARSFVETAHAAMSLLARGPVPTVAAVNGYALGGGAELALACDVRLAAGNAVFGFPEVTLGILPGMGGTQRLPRLVGDGRARELVFTGRRIGAEEARGIGMVERVVEEGAALSAAREMAATIAKNAPLAVRNAKSALGKATDVDLVSGLDYEAAQFSTLFSTQDAEEGMTAFSERRSPDFRGN